MVIWSIHTPKVRSAEIDKMPTRQKERPAFASRSLFMLICNIHKLVVDELLVIVVPAVELSDLLTNLLRRMLGMELSHSLEVNL